MESTIVYSLLNLPKLMYEPWIKPLDLAFLPFLVFPLHFSVSKQKWVTNLYLLLRGSFLSACNGPHYSVDFTYGKLKIT